MADDAAFKAGEFNRLAHDAAHLLQIKGWHRGVP
jgi:hypothetical protein